MGGFGAMGGTMGGHGVVGGWGGGGRGYGVYRVGAFMGWRSHGGTGVWGNGGAGEAYGGLCGWGALGGARGCVRERG